MNTFALNQYNDIYLDGTGQIAMSSGADCRASILRSAILTVRGEIQLDTELGIPYFTTIFDTKTKLKDWTSAVRKSILSFRWVKTIDSFNCGFEGDILNYSIDVSVSLDDGETRTINVSGSIDTGIRIPVYVDPQGEQEMGDKLTDSNGIFYLPIGKVNGIPRFRQMKTVTDPETGTATSLSDQQYTRDDSGNFNPVS